MECIKFGEKAGLYKESTKKLADSNLALLVEMSVQVNAAM